MRPSQPLRDRIPPLGALAFLVVGALVAAPVLAASLSTSSMTILAGAQATRNVTSMVVSSKVPTVRVVSSNATVATAAYTAKDATSGTITVSGVAPGSATISFTDAKSTYKFSVSVKAPMVVTTMPSPLRVDVGKSASLMLANLYSSNVTVSPSSTTYFTTKILNSTTVIVTGLARGTSSVVVSDGLTRLTVPIEVTAGTLPTLSGRVLAANCFQCHNTNALGGFAGIADKPSAEIYLKLKEFGAKSLTSGIMAAHTGGYTDYQLQNIAAYVYAVNH